MLAEAATGSFATLVGAILPCFWVYRDIGAAIAAESPPGNFYQAWIDTYADPGFAAATDAMIAVYDRAHVSAGADEQARMQRAFQKCCQYEWMFWDAAWREEAWPV
jgi:thiaminase